MNITINRKEKTIQIEEGISIGELVDELKALIGSDWKKYSITVIGELFEPWIPDLIYPLYPTWATPTYLLELKTPES